MRMRNTNGGAGNLQSFQTATAVGTPQNLVIDGGSDGHGCHVDPSTCRQRIETKRFCSQAKLEGDVEVRPAFARIGHFAGPFLGVPILSRGVNYHPDFVSFANLGSGRSRESLIACEWGRRFGGGCERGTRKNRRLIPSRDRSINGFGAWLVMKQNIKRNGILELFARQIGEMDLWIHAITEQPQEAWMRDAKTGASDNDVGQTVFCVGAPQKFAGSSRSQADHGNVDHAV